MSLVMAKLQEIANTGPAVLAIHHAVKGSGTGKNKTTLSRGSGDITGAIDVEYGMTTKDKTIEIQSFKPRVEPLEPVTLEEVTAYRLWKDLGIDRGQLSKFFSGKVNISLALLERIADYLDYDLVLVKRECPKKGGKKNGDNLQAKKCVLGKVLSER